MPALVAGKPAPRFSLPIVGGGDFSLEQALQRGPVLLAFFKISCPVCQFAMPYVERLYQRYGKAATIIGVSQDDASASRSFAKEYGLTMPLALDDTRSYPVSNDYGLTNVPTLFYIEPAGDISISCVGWSRADFEQIAKQLAECTSTPVSPLIAATETVPDYKGG